MRGLAAANGLAIGRGDATIVLDLDPDARPTRGEGPMLRLLPPVGARSADLNRALLDPGDWEAVFATADGTAAWARRPIARAEDDDAAALLDHAVTRALEALDEGWAAMVGGEPAVPLPRPLVGGRFRPQETFLNWALSARQVTARVRACAGPWGGARSQLGETPVFLLDARVLAEETPPRCDPGTLLRVDRGLEVATGRGVVRIERLRPGWRPPRPAGEFAAESGLSQGYQFV